jgi:hypothetical protein
MKQVATDVGYLSREMVKFQTIPGRLYVFCFEFNMKYMLNSKQHIYKGLMYGYTCIYGLIEVLNGGWMIRCMDELIF